MTLMVEPPVGEPYEYHASSALNLRLTAEPILAGLTYPALMFLDDVRTVVDAGANCGAASIHFALAYPDATVHAVEPGLEQLDLLRRNVRGFPRVQVHPVGLSSEDREAHLYHGADDTGLASVVRSPWNRADSDLIVLRRGATWAAENDIDRIDVLKVDVELSELDVLVGLEPYLPEVRVVYVEYGSRQIRREIDALLGSSHELFLAEITLESGECTYVRRDVADHPEAMPFLIRTVAARRAG